MLEERRRAACKAKTDLVAGQITCPKCKFTSGDDWEQCEGACPMPGSPHYDAFLARPDDFQGLAATSNLP